MSNSGVSFDFIVVGGGTNGLTAACYLAKEGYSTLVLESLDYLGGGAITQDITLPGFHHDVFATSINIWRASSIQQELELEKYGYREIDPDPVASTPFKNGRAVTIFHDMNLTMKSISQFSERDARKFKEIYDFYLESKDILLGSLASPPLSFSAMMSTLEESDTGLDFLQFTYLSARDWIEENFESEETKAFLALWGVNHVSHSPEDVGSALLVLVFVGLLQDRGAGVPIGGMKTLVNALEKYALTHGATIIKGKEVEHILVKDGKALGVSTRDGKSYECRKGIVSNVEPKSLFLKLVPESSVSSDFRRRVQRFKYSKVTQVMIHAALDTWFDYRPTEIQKSGLVQIGDSLDQISKAYNDCVIGRMPSEPFMTIDNTTGYDESRAPRGKHIMWNFVRAPVFLGGKPWTQDNKEKFADLCLNRLSNYAPNAKNIVLKRVVLSPQDIGRMNSNLINGDPNGGQASMDQSLALRPFPYWSQYRTPIKGLYMCSASTHPGGGVSGFPGHNAALAVLEDVKSSS